MANVIEQAAKAIRTRLAELVGEQQQLQKALGALEGLLGSERRGTAEVPTRSAAPRRRPARRAPAGARARATAARRRGGPSRADQFLALAGERPGITVAEAADRLKTSRQTLYNGSARLQREGRLRMDGRGFYPAEGSPQPASERAPRAVQRAPHDSLDVARDVHVQLLTKKTVPGGVVAVPRESRPGETRRGLTADRRLRALVYPEFRTS
jgi:hypothetical protein